MEVEKFLNMCDSASDVLLDDICPDENLVEHSGIFGMKWGNRRYQNEDGTYTEEGKKRRRKTFSNMSRSEKKAAKKALKKARDAREEKAERKEAVQRGDIRYAQMNFDKFSEAEITELYRRYDMKREIDRINTQKSQETLDKWVSRFNSAGKMAVSIDTIYNSLNDISEKSKDNKAAEKRRKNEAKKAKLLLDEQQLRNDKAKAELNRYMEEPEEYRKAKRQYDLEKDKASVEQAKANIEQTKANTQKTLAEARKNDVKQVLVSDPALEQKYRTLWNNLYTEEAKKYKNYTKSARDWNIKKWKETHPYNFVDYVNSGGDTAIMEALIKAEKGANTDEIANKAAEAMYKKMTKN